MEKPPVWAGWSVLTGTNRVAENRNHWADVVAGQAIGAAVSVFLVVFVVKYFQSTRVVLAVSPSDAGPAPTVEASAHSAHSVSLAAACVELQNPDAFTEIMTMIQ